MAAASAVVRRAPASSSLADVLNLILDKGLVIDAYVRVSLVGIELLTVDARIVIAGVDTYLRFAEAAQRLELGSANDARGLFELTSGASESASQGKTKGVLDGVKESMGIKSDEDDDEG